MLSVCNNDWIHDFPAVHTAPDGEMAIALKQLKEVILHHESFAS
jgi:hypothetical protein